MGTKIIDTTWTYHAFCRAFCLQRPGFSLLPAAGRVVRPRTCDPVHFALCFRAYMPPPHAGRGHTKNQHNHQNHRLSQQYIKLRTLVPYMDAFLYCPHNLARFNFQPPPISSPIRRKSVSPVQGGRFIKFSCPF